MTRHSTHSHTAWTIAAEILLTVLSSAMPLAQQNANTLDTLLKGLSQRGQFSGSILIVDHGNKLYENAFGEADIERSIPFAPTTPCYIASLTKQFTAMGVMMLADQNRLAYSDPLSKYFPQFPSYAQRVTLRHLLNHTSGLPDYGLDLGLEHPGLTNGEVLRALVTRDSLNFSPGTRFEYSNSGYIVLAMIIEKVSGKPYGVFLKENLFAPLQMNDTFVDDSTRPHIPGRARAYTRFGDGADYDLLTYGEGGIYSTVEDLFKWDQALYTEKLVKAATLAEAFTKARLNGGAFSNYGFGWVIGDYEGQTTTSHAGRYGGFNAYIKRFLSDRRAIIFLTNHDFKNMRAIGDPIINILNGKPFVLPRRSPAEAMFKTYGAKGIMPAIQQYRTLRAANDSTYDFNESELNELGYELLGMKRFEDAIAILKLNAEEYSTSANVYDSLGEAYLDNAQKDLAIRNYRKSLELNPGNVNAASMLKRLANN